MSSKYVRLVEEVSEELEEREKYSMSDIDIDIQELLNSGKKEKEVIKIIAKQYKFDIAGATELVKATIENMDESVEEEVTEEEEEVTEEVESTGMTIVEGKTDPILQKVADIVKDNEESGLMGLRDPLEKEFKKKDIDFTFAGAAHFQIKYKDKKIMIVNKKYVKDAEIVVGELAIGYM